MSERRNELSGLDIKVCVEELKEVVGSWTGKVYQIGNLFLFKLNTPGKDRGNLLIEPGLRIHLTERDYETPMNPPSFAMLLRKHLRGKKLMDIEQPGMERIVELEFARGDNKRILVAELFGGGNLILCYGNKEIIKPLKSRSWEHREIKQGENYKKPPRRGKDITSISLEELSKILDKEPDLVRALARNLNIGGNMAEEICSRARLSKDKGTDELKNEEVSKIYESIQGLLEEEPNPRILYKNGSPVDFLPFPFDTKKKLEFRSYEKFNEVLDDYFAVAAEEEDEKEKKSQVEQEIEKAEKRLKNQKAQVDSLKSESQQCKSIADEISKHHDDIDFILNEINSSLEKDGWKRVRKELNKDSDSKAKWTKPVEEVSPDRGKVIINLPEGEAELDVRKSAFKNANNYYKEYKKAKSKIEGAKEAVEETKEKLETLREKGTKKTGKEVSGRKKSKKWYDKYRWFISSDGFLVIGGRDKQSNREVVKTHMDERDKYVHADMQGAPHVVIKGEGEEVPQSTIREAAEFAVMHSRAWREGLGNMDVYIANPDQVSENAPSGEYLPKGGFMVKGKRDYLTVPVSGAVGLIDRRKEKVPICGPKPAITEHSETVIEIEPGKTKKSDLAKKIKKKIEKKQNLELQIDDLMRILPPGSGRIKNG
ncbi:MAG: ribosome rescue protein RqcH [Candidatus Hadarchaeota archaeon]